MTPSSTATAKCKACGRSYQAPVRNGLLLSRKCFTCRLVRKPKCRRADKRIRTGSYGKLPKGWKGLDRPKQCEICKAEGPTLIDHIVLRRRAIWYGDPEAKVNLIALGRKCPCHGAKVVLERAILAGNCLTIASEFDRLQWPRERVLAAFDYYGLAYGLKRIWGIAT